MRDDIFWGNLIGLLKKGRWNLSLEESEALVAVYVEALERSKPPVPKPVVEPIKKVKKSGNTGPSTTK